MSLAIAAAGEITDKRPVLVRTNRSFKDLSEDVFNSINKNVRDLRFQSAIILKLKEDKICPEDALKLLIESRGKSRWTDLRKALIAYILEKQKDYAAKVEKMNLPNNATSELHNYATHNRLKKPSLQNFMITDLRLKELECCVVAHIRVNDGKRTREFISYPTLARKKTEAGILASAQLIVDLVDNGFFQPVQK